MPDMREGGLGTAACYLTVERLALQAGVESPFWDETSLLMGGCEEPWYKKPLTPRRLRSFLKRYGGSLPDDDGQRGHAASVFADVMRLHGILGIERTDAHRALADCYDELAVLNAELSVIMQSYAREMDYCRGELLHIAGEIAEEIGE